MNETIEKLKKNWVAWAGLDDETHKLLEAIDETQRVTIAMQTNDGIIWPLKGGPFYDDRIYRIHKDYQPEPDTPVFEGYVLCEVHGGRFQSVGDDEWHWIHKAIDFGCVGGVFKEKLGVIMNSLTAFHSEKHDILLHSANLTQLREGFKSATLGWVVFKDDMERP